MEKDIAEPEAGPELDAVMAERMGWDQPPEGWCPSVNFVDAWKLLLRLSLIYNIPSPDGISLTYGTKSGWTCSLKGGKSFSANGGESAALAICRLIYAASADERAAGRPPATPYSILNPEPATPPRSR